MDLSPPSSYSPSSLSQFTSCPLAYRYSYIEKRPQPPQIAATKGTIVHRALELLFLKNKELRTIEEALKDLEITFLEYQDHDDLVGLNLNEEEYLNLKSQCKTLVRKYFELENPEKIEPVGLELKLETKIDGTTLRGIIDRLELDENGDLVVTDYKTGSAPRANTEQARLSGVHFYALLCERIFGVLPSKVQLLYLSDPVSIVAVPNELSIKGIKNKSKAIDSAVKSACQNNNFQPKESALCGWCGYHELCPVKGGTIPDV